MATDKKKTVWKGYLTLFKSKAKEKAAELVVAGALSVITGIFAKYVWQLPGVIQIVLFVCVAAAVLGIVALIRQALSRPPKPTRADEVKKILEGMLESGHKLLARHPVLTPMNILPLLREIEAALHHIRGRKNEVFYAEFISTIHAHPAEETWIRSMTWLRTLIPTITDESLTVEEE